VANAPFRRVRPGDAAWPSEAKLGKIKDRGWRAADKNLSRRLQRVKTAPDGAGLRQRALKNLANPYFISDEPAYTQASGWVDAWTSAPSVYAVAAEKHE